MPVIWPLVSKKNKQYDLLQIGWLVVVVDPEVSGGSFHDDSNRIGSAMAPD